MKNERIIYNLNWCKFPKDFTAFKVGKKVVIFFHYKK